MANIVSIDTRKINLVDAPAKTIHDLSENEAFLVRIYSCIIRLRQSVSNQDVITHLLNIGCDLWRAQNAVIIEPISSTIYKVNYFYSKDESSDIYIGKHLNGAENTHLAFLAESQLESVGAINIKVIKDAQYSFIGAKFCSTRDKEYVLYFENLSSKDDLGDERHNLNIQLLAEGVAFMVDQSNIMTLHKEHDQEVSARGTVRSLEEYTEQAKIPEMYGVPARVLDSLERRIGEMPLSISNVAEDLNLSKRTLQRRLQQQDVNFADLRDNVRFHYSIGYLLKGHQSIDGISTLLDFSDRTSFTNAFKRWTGLSPSNFRKLFRDYV